MLVVLTWTSAKSQQGVAGEHRRMGAGEEGGRGEVHSGEAQWKTFWPQGMQLEW